MAPQDWGAPASKGQSSVQPLALVGGGILAVGAVFAFLFGPLVGIGLAVIGIAAFALWLTSTGARFLKVWQAVPASEGEGRLKNLVEGLASDLGTGVPKIWIVESAEANAFSLWHRGANLGVTRALLDSFTRTETEAVVAHGLVRLRDEKGGPTYRAALEGLGLNFAERDLLYVDVKAAAATRYPPALAAAVEKALPRSGAGAALWFVGDGKGFTDQAARAAALRDL